jgi:hypothetical protein
MSFGKKSSIDKYHSTVGQQSVNGIYGERMGGGGEEREVSIGEFLWCFLFLFFH